MWTKKDWRHANPQCQENRLNIESNSAGVVIPATTCFSEFCELFPEYENHNKQQQSCDSREIGFVYPPEIRDCPRSPSSFLLSGQVDQIRLDCGS